METTTISLDEFKLADTAIGEFEGYASVFNLEDDGGDIMLPGAFKSSLGRKGKNAIKMLWQHNPSEPIGVWTDIKEDSKGLFVKGQLIEGVRRADEARALLKAKAIDGMSIGYVTKRAERDEETYKRKLIEVDLWEVSLVTFPMNRTARATSVKEATIRDVEQILREAGLPNTFAKLVASHGYDEAKRRLDSREAGHEDLAEVIRRATAAMKG